ncbi:MAG: hypothetical protein U5L74_12225 [Ideonella sp.]|nr:hypothetical protein [Ideonella sp.]
MRSRSAAPTRARDSLVWRLTRLNLQVLAVTMLLSFGLLALALWLSSRDMHGQGGREQRPVAGQ